MKRVRVLGGALASVTLAAASLCCVPPTSPERMDCFQSCARAKDACLLRATSADGIQACDRASAACGERCPE